MSDASVYYSYTKSPCGDLLVACTDAGLTHIHFRDGEASMEPGETWIRDESRLLNAVDQLIGYFDGSQKRFDLRLAPKGTPFQHRVWEALQAIPFGETVSYSDIAHRIGQPTAVRAVASANARNPLAIVIPCHRVIGSDGKLRGYAGGLPIKQQLLDHEWTFSAESDAGQQLLLSS